MTAVVDDLKSEIRGAVLAPNNAGYYEARKVWNAMVDKRPALIVQCAGAADVVAAVNFARTHHLPLAVRGGAHSIAGNATCDDGVVVDLSPMKSIRVDPAARTARAEPGLRWEEFDRETQAFGLATTGGTVGDTGIAGLTLGGGFGWLGGKFGMTVDNLLSADVVLASGQLVRANAQENRDLFWAIRGGSGNFGVVTSFEYRLHEVGPMIAGGLVLHPLSNAVAMLRFFREFSRTVPDELTVAAGLLTAPDGNPMAGMIAAHCGRVEDGEKALRPLKEFGTPALDALGPIPYVAQQSLFRDAFPPNSLNYWKADMVPEVSDGLIDTTLAHFARVPSPKSAVLWFPIAGAASRVASDATAYPHRRGFHMGIYSLWTGRSETEQNVAWAREGWNSIQPYAAGGVYVNELGLDESDDRIRGAYGLNYERLSKLKTRYDPENLFRLNANIRPG